MHIVLDAMGSDDHPGPELAAATESHSLWGDRLTLTGPAEELESRIDASLAEIVDAPQGLEMADKPALAAKNKPNSSMAVGMRLLKHDGADAFVTMGNTGGAMATALFQLGRIRGGQVAGLGQLDDEFSDRSIACGESRHGRHNQ